LEAADGPDIGTLTGDAGRIVFDDEPRMVEVDVIRL